MPSEHAPPARAFAIVPAAGRSRRMGAPKQLLDVGGHTLLSAVLQPLAAARIEGIVLVIHAAIGKHIAGAELPGVFVALNDDETSEMIDSVRIGLDAWSAHATIRTHDGFLICPADQPGITTADFNTCLGAFQETPDRIIVASRAGRRGHPIVFPAALTAFVQSRACDSGLNALAHAYPDRVVLAQCSSAGVTRDIDTPADYDGLR